MSLTIIALFGLGIASFLVAGSFFYGKSLSARRNANFLARVSEMRTEHDSDLMGNAPQRLAKNVRLQKALRDAPGVGELAELLEATGKSTTVAQLLAQMILTFMAVMVITKLLDWDIALSVVLGAGGAVVPLALMVRARWQRATAFEAQLPQALELISLFLRSGRSLPQAFVGATEELMPPASEEFIHAAEQYRMGRPLDASLKALANKYPDSLGFRLFAIAVSVLGQTGGNLVEVLERIKRTLDASVTYSMRLRAVTSESRMSAYILAALPGFFLLLITVMSPAYSRVLFTETMGHWLLLLFAGIWSLGLFWVRSLMNSKVMG